MENEKNKIVTEPISIAPVRKDYTLPASILIAALILAGAWIYTTGLKTNALKKNIPTSSDATQNVNFTSRGATSTQNTENTDKKSPLNNTVAVKSKEIIQPPTLEEIVLPAGGIVLPVRWGDLGLKIINAGVIDLEKFESLYVASGSLDGETRKLLSESNNGNLKITPENSGIILNLFWALGLANKNDVLEKGPMMDPRYGGADRFASTGGWTIAKGDPMDHYSRHAFFALSPEQQALVEKISKGIYRPCCNNATYFPDCNHGMAMLGLLELMASQGVPEQEMWKAALAINSYWFPDTYLTIATYMKNKGVDWNNVNPQEVLGINYSSASGYAQIAAQVKATQQQRGGSGCGI